MQTQVTELSYRTMLESEFARRMARHPRYSLRAFARDIDLPAPKLSGIFKDKAGISGEKARKVAQKLKFSDAEATLFVSLVEAKHSRSQAGRKQALHRLNILKAKDSFSMLELERFRLIGNWIHFALLELTEINNFNSDPEWIAQRLQVSVEDVGLALDRLFRMNLLVFENGRLKQTQEDMATPNDIPSEDLKNHHRQLIQRGLKTLKLSVNERDFSSVTMAIDSSKMKEAKQAIIEFRRKFCKDIQDTPEKDRLYCLGIQFFPLDRGDEHD